MCICVYGQRLILYYDWFFSDVVMKVTTWFKVLVIVSLIFSNIGAFIAKLGYLGLASAEPFVDEQKMYGGIGAEHSTCVQPTSDSGFIITVIEGSRSYIIKTNNSGNKVWEKTIDLTSPGVVWCNSIQQTRDGGYIIVGEIDTQDVGFLGLNREVLLVKTDASGNQQWYKTIGEKTKDIAYSVQITSDGGYIVAGSTEVYGTSLRNTYIIRTDLSGNKIWAKSLGGNLDNVAYCVQVALDGGFIVAGYVSTLNAKWDMYLIKIDSSGNEVFERTIGGAKNEVAYSMQLTPDGGLIIAGSTESFGAGGLDVYLVKTDVSGNKVWEKTFGGTQDDWAHSIQITPDGGYILVGQTLSYGTRSWNAYLVKTDSSGNKLWEKNFGGEGDDTAISVQVTAEGGYLMVGDSNSFGAGSTDVYIVRLYDMGQIVDNLKAGYKEQDDSLRLLQQTTTTDLRTQISDLNTHISDLQSALQSANSNISKLQSDLQSSNGQIKDLQSALESATKMNYVALGVAVVGVIIAIASILLRRK